MVKSFIKKTALLTCVVSVATAVSGCTTTPTTGEKAMTNYESTHFYTDKKLDIEKTKAAYYELMASFNYPEYPVMKTDEFWVCDFKQKDMSKMGMAGIFWMNEKGTYGEVGNKKYKGKYKADQYGYLGHEIYLLPNQALPEHFHLGGPAECGPKMESWQVRYGSVRFFAELKFEGAKLIKDLPKAELPWGYGEAWFKSVYYVDAVAGDVVKLGDPQSRHFQQAGPKGAIVTEYGTYHNDVRFTKPGLVWGNTGDK